MKKSSAFTLIEILIAASIIAILSAIAVPNYMEAQVRSKVARTQNDHRALTTAIGAFIVDHNTSPAGLATLTRPTAYITTVPVDPFLLPEQQPYHYTVRGGLDYTDWVLMGRGPDKILDQIRYDTTNGTRSAGDIIYERKPSLRYYWPESEQ
ncbi:TPA: hypothetical protein DDW35_12570 [Candidatus Sumerlaeota bacterium]|jgi:prepilin-type N-terminal cleavage/methylation domain-containing protein|nr:hypothetical protein [Candidatus Sumerlaeota bacterium]